MLLYCLLFIFLMLLPEQIRKWRQRKEIGKLLLSAYDKIPLNQKQIDILCKNYGLALNDKKILLRNQFSESVKSENSDLIKYFQNLYEELEKDEPFEGLPSEVRLPLERIRESLPQGKEYLIQPLTSKLQELSAKSFRTRRWMWVLTIASFIVGLVGTFFGAFPYLKSHDLRPLPASSIITEKNATGGGTRELNIPSSSPSKTSH